MEILIAVEVKKAKHSLYLTLLQKW